VRGVDVDPGRASADIPGRADHAKLGAILKSRPANGFNERAAEKMRSLDISWIENSLDERGVQAIVPPRGKSPPSLHVPKR